MPRGIRKNKPALDAAENIVPPVESTDEAAPQVSKYASDTEQDDDDSLPLANLDAMNQEQLLGYGMRNLNMDMSGKTAQEMRDTLSNQIGFRRAGGR